MALPSNQLEYQKSHNEYGYWDGFKKKQDIKISEIQVIQQFIYSTISKEPDKEVKFQ